MIDASHSSFSEGCPQSYAQFLGISLGLTFDGSWKFLNKNCEAIVYCHLHALSLYGILLNLLFFNGLRVFFAMISNLLLPSSRLLFIANKG